MQELKQTKPGIYGNGLGGQYIPETLMSELEKVNAEFEKIKTDDEFQAELHDLLVNYANRPSLLYYAKNMTEDLGGAKIYLKREDLNHTGAHKINNVIGQALMAKHMGKKRLIAETGAGQHGVQQQPSPLYWVWNVKYSWAKWTLIGKNLTSIEWNFLAQKSTR